MARTLDRARPFGEIFGFDPEGRRYEQDGVYFDAAGDEIGGSEPAPRTRSRVVGPPAASQVDIQLAQ